ncbi:hypothetical protein PTKIN_Ptkin01aG0323100 [Pterospermum kingtungense]
MYGVNKHYGTPTNPCAPDRVPGGSSNGSAVAVAAMLVYFSLGVIPLSQSFDTEGWFAWDPMILNRVGRVLLHIPDEDPIKPNQIIIPEDCFCLSSIPVDRTAQVLVRSIEKLFGGQCVKHVILGDYVKDQVPSLQHFMDKGNELEDNIPSFAALSSAMRLLRSQPDFGPEISERIWDAIKVTGEKDDICHSVRTELRNALISLLGDQGVLALPTTPDEPPKVQANPATLDLFFSRPFGLLSIAGVSGFCQVSIPLGMHDNVPVAISLVAKHGSVAFLLDLVETLYDTLKEEIIEC